MKKKYNIIEDYQRVNSLNLKNTLVSGNAVNDKINTSLLEDIEKAAVNAGVRVTITTAITGHSERTSSGYPSRHVNGDAVDISMVDGKGWSSVDDAKSKNIYNGILDFVKEMESMGYVVNKEVNNPKSILYFGFSDGQHENHLHVSNTSDGTNNTGGSGNSGGTSSDDDFGVGNFVKNFCASKILKKTMNINESPEKKLLEEIDKIKRLL